MSTTHSLGLTRSKAIRVPSGDQSGLCPFVSETTLEPSAFITRMVPSDSNTILDPSGDHLGASPATPSVTEPDPSAFITRIPELALRTILDPSGDQSPSKASIDGVRFVSSEPSSRIR